MDKIPITIWGADVFDGCVSNPKLKRFLDNALIQIMKESLGMFRRSSCVLVLSRDIWSRLLQSPEVMSWLQKMNRVISVEEPTHLFGFEIKWVEMPDVEELQKQLHDFVFPDGPEEK